MTTRAFECESPRIGHSAARQVPSSVLVEFHGLDLILFGLGLSLLFAFLEVLLHNVACSILLRRHLLPPPLLALASQALSLGGAFGAELFQLLVCQCLRGRLLLLPRIALLLKVAGALNLGLALLRRPSSRAGQESDRPVWKRQGSETEGGFSFGVQLS